MVGTPHEIAKKLYFFSIETGKQRRIVIKNGNESKSFEPLSF